MRKCLAIGLLFCALCALAGCSDEEVVTQFNEVLQAAGEKVLTSEADLQGTRTFGEDGYVGTYQAQGSPGKRPCSAAPRWKGTPETR